MECKGENREEENGKYKYKYEQKDNQRVLNEAWMKKKQTNRIYSRRQFLGTNYKFA